MGNSPTPRPRLPDRERRAFHMLVEATLATRPDTLSSSDARAVLVDAGFGGPTIDRILRRLYEEKLITAGTRADGTIFVDGITHAGWRTYAEDTTDDYESTLQRIYDGVARAKGTCTAEEIALELGLNRWLVRHYMNELKRRGNGHVVIRPDGMAEMRIER